VLPEKRHKGLPARQVCAASAPEEKPMQRALSLACVVLGFGCATYRSAETAAARALIPVETENQLGEQLHQQLEKEGVRYVQDPAVVSKIQEIAAPILAEARRVRPEVEYHLYVVDDPGTVNAFATPGGSIYLESGLLGVIDNEAELAGVIAHEAGHIIGRHAARNIVQVYGVQTVAAIALGKDPSQLQQLAASIAAQGTILAHSRSQETEADEYGAQITSKVGYSPQGLVNFLEKLVKQSGRTPRPLTWTSTHPDSQERVDHLQDYIQKKDLTGGREGESLAPLRQRALGGGGGPAH
jgi:predicted Zn-dependent protease